MILGERRAEAVEAARRGQRHAVSRRGLSARGDAQLPGAPRLEPRRRRALHARAVGAVVRRLATWRKSPAQWDAAKLRWVNAHHLKATPDDRARAAGRRSSSSGAASTCRSDERCAQRVRAVQGPLRDRRRSSPTGCAMFFADVRRSAEDLAAHVTDAVQAGARDAVPTSSRACAWNKAAIAAGHQGNARRARPEDAAARACRCACWCAAARRRRRSMRCSSCSRVRRCSRVCRRL